MAEVKERLRRQKLDARKAMSSMAVTGKSRKIGKTLFGLPEFQSAGTIMFYVSFGREVATHEMIMKALKMRKKVVVPKIISNRQLRTCSIKNFKKDLKTGCFGILEPKHSIRRVVPKNKLDLVIVPGVCFDRTRGARIGFGKGFYDRFLGQVKGRAKLIGLAFEKQLVKAIPCEKQDINMDMIVTEKRVIRIKN
jgi:5-formyltetrahydrofolate cyclo-ligase